MAEWRRRLVDGYRDAAEIAEQDGVRSGVLVPFAGRVCDAKYSWDGEPHDLRPGSSDREIFHGFLREIYFELVDVVHLGDSVRIRFRALTSRSTQNGYPFSLRVDVSYEVHQHGLSMELTVVNTSGHTAPVTLGWHPYLRVPSAESVDEMRMQLSATTVLPTDGRLLPLHGASQNIQGTDLDFREGGAIGSTAIDACFLRPVDMGNAPRTETSLVGPAGDRVTVWQASGATYVYSGDRLARRSRRSIAIEPISHIPDAVNDAASRSAIALGPQASRTFTCGFEYSAAPTAVG